MSIEGAVATHGVVGGKSEAVVYRVRTPREELLYVAMFFVFLKCGGRDFLGDILMMVSGIALDHYEPVRRKCNNNIYVPW